MDTRMGVQPQRPGDAFAVEWQMREFPDRNPFPVSTLTQPRAATVLVVSADPRTRDRIGAWLSETGHEVIECQGPGAPDYTCLGGRGKECPLAKAADVVVLDLNLESDAVVSGTPSWRLLDYYLERGHPVVAVSGPEQMGRFFLDERVISLDWPVDGEAVTSAVSYLTDRRSSVSQIGTFRFTPRRRRHRF